LKGIVGHLLGVDVDKRHYNYILLDLLDPAADPVAVSVQPVGGSGLAELPLVDLPVLVLAIFL
jgi:hypothetical protein